MSEPEHPETTMDTSPPSPPSPPSLDADDIRRVLDALDKSAWDEAVITVGAVSIAVARNGAALPSAGPTTVPAAPAPVPPPAPAATPDAGPTPAPAAAAAPASTPAPAAPGLVVPSPSVGVFWRAPEPGAPPFVEVGQHVEAGHTLCIVEVMKLMSHVDAPVAGTVVEVHVDNAASVEHDAPLFTLAPDEA